MRGVSHHPVRFLVAVRWLTWVIALIQTSFGAGTAEHGVSPALLLAATAIASTAETAFAWRREFRLPLQAGTRRLLLTVALLDGLMGLLLIYLSGGPTSPFYHYAVTALLVPAFLLPLTPALLWSGVFVAAYITVAELGGVATGGVVESLGRRAGTVTTPLLVVLVTRYLSRLIETASHERERAERALTETAALFRVSETIVEHMASEGELLEEIARAAYATGRFKGVSLRVFGSDGTVEAEYARGTAGGSDAPALPLAVRGEHLGVLIVTPVSDYSHSGATAFAAALARQTALGLYDARLFRQREELATQAERARIAREIHDGMAQSLYMLSLGLEACAEAGDAQESELGRRLRALVGISKQALWEARRYIFDLTPPVEGEHTLVAMFENLTREFETVSRVPVSLTIEGEPRRLPPTLAGTLYRIGQEALANVFKHAHATAVAVTLTFEAGSVRLFVTDDGRGLPEQPRAGYGLANIHRRAEDAGGACTIDSTPATGTRVAVELPAPIGSEPGRNGR